MSLFQKSRKLALKPRRFVHQFVSMKKKLPKYRQKGLTNKKLLYIFLQKSDVTEHDQCVGLYAENRATLLVGIR